MMATIQEIQSEIVDDFSFLPEWDERYTYLIEIGQKMAVMPASPMPMFDALITFSGIAVPPYMASMV